MKCLTITHISVSVALLNHLIRVLSALRFLFVVYGFEWLVRVLLVSLVLAFVVVYIIFMSLALCLDSFLNTFVLI